MTKYKYTDVFVPGGFPRFTYNPRETIRLEERLRAANENLCKLITITGQTKSGKTVLARKIFPVQDSIWVDGGSVQNDDDFWNSVIDQAGAFQVTDVESSRQRGAEIGGRGRAGANFFVAKGEAEIEGGLSHGQSDGTKRSRAISSRIVALSALRNSSKPLIVDDFHYLPREFQGNLIRAIKSVIFDGHSVAIIAIPHRRYDAVKVEREMAGRIEGISVPVWSHEELKFIPKTGFSLLGVDFSDDLAEELAEEALGSPHLMQEFCRKIAAKQSFSDGMHVDFQQETRNLFREVAETIGRPIFEKLARGPRQRTDRIPRSLKDGRTVDIYQLVLFAIAHIRPGLVSLEYEELRSALRDVSAASLPQAHEVARVLKHMATIASSDHSSTPVIDFEEGDNKLHITDPFFAFYLRWGDLKT